MCLGPARRVKAVARTMPGGQLGVPLRLASGIHQEPARGADSNLRLAVQVLRGGAASRHIDANSVQAAGAFGDYILVAGLLPGAAAITCADHCFIPPGR